MGDAEMSVKCGDVRAVVRMTGVHTELVNSMDSVVHCLQTNCRVFLDYGFVLVAGQEELVWRHSLGGGRVLSGSMRSQSRRFELTSRDAST